MMDFAHASDFSVEALNNVVSAMNEDLDLALAVKAFQVDRVPNTALRAGTELPPSTKKKAPAGAFFFVL